jgi:hypothetical protein
MWQIDLSGLCLSEVLGRAIRGPRQYRRLLADSLTKSSGAIASVPTIPAQTFRDLALDCPFSARDLAAALWLEGAAVAMERAGLPGRLVAKAANALRLCRFLAIPVGDARGA